MSSLTGHSKITHIAVMEFSASLSAAPLAGGLNLAGLPDAVVSRDLLDVLSVSLASLAAAMDTA